MRAFPQHPILKRTAMFSRDLTLARYDAELFAAMEQEAQRQGLAQPKAEQMRGLK